MENLKLSTQKQTTPLCQTKSKGNASHPKRGCILLMARLMYHFFHTYLPGRAEGQNELVHWSTSEEQPA